MISVAEAQRIVLEHARPLPPAVVPLGTSALNLVLAEDVASDLDMPPYDKSLMDGYAVRAADVASGQATLTVVEEIHAGHTPQKRLGPGQAARIMTGGMIPAGADAVVMVERTKMIGADRVQIDDRPKSEQNILRRGREMHAGEIILKAGTRLRPQEFGLLAAVGRTHVRVHPAPRVAILPTGDEIVPPSEKPGPGQIRNSNGMMLLAQAQRSGAVPHLVGIARDSEESLRALIAEGLKADVLILSGGVSAGKKDLVPGVLQALGVQAYFHKVEMKPGKPVFFGIGSGESGVVNWENQSSASGFLHPLVFGLPGNPVSSMVCFELFVRPALRRLMGRTDALPVLWRAALSEGCDYRTDRPTYHPVSLEWKDGKCHARLLPWFGSPDLRGTAAADAFAVIPKGEHRFEAGQLIDVLPVEYF